MMSVVKGVDSRGRREGRGAGPGQGQGAHAAHLPGMSRFIIYFFFPSHYLVHRVSHKLSFDVLVNVPSLFPYFHYLERDDKRNVPFASTTYFTTY